MGSRGFTLLELLVVIVIAGILTGFVLLSLRGATESARVDAAAERLAALIEHQCNEALLLNRTIRLQVDERGYRFAARARERWHPLPDSAFRERSWPVPLSATLELDGRVVGSEGIYCRPTGELSPFELRLVPRNGPGVALRGTATGNVERLRGPG